MIKVLELQIRFIYILKCVILQGGKYSGSFWKYPMMGSSYRSFCLMQERTELVILSAGSRIQGAFSGMNPAVCLRMLVQLIDTKIKLPLGSKKIGTHFHLLSMDSTFICKANDQAQGFAFVMAWSIRRRWVRIPWMDRGQEEMEWKLNSNF